MKLRGHAPRPAPKRDAAVSRWRALVLAPVLLTASCQQARLEQMLIDQPACATDCGDLASRPGRELAMNRRWQNRPLSELQSVLGKPRMIMNIPGGGNPPGFVAVYGEDAASGCIDAFAFIYGTDPVVRAYHCR